MAAHDQDTHELRCEYVDQLGEQALELIRKMASASQCSTLEVVDALREELDAEIAADLVEVSPGSFLPSAEAAQLFARREREARCARCQLDERYEAFEISDDEYGRTIVDTKHSCHDDELHAFVAERHSLPPSKR